MSETPIEITWQAGTLTGWQLIGTHLALRFAAAGRRVVLAGGLDPTGVPVPWLPILRGMQAPGDPSEHRIRLAALGNHFPAPDPIPNRTHLGLAVFEDTAIPPDAVDRLSRFDRLITCSTWAEGILAGYGLSSSRWYQGYDDALFHAAPKVRTAADGRFYVFSGGKLEYRKGQDLVVAAFKRFLDTPDGDGAVLVTAWQNRWPQTMDGLWLNGHVKGVPVTRLGRQEVVPWVVANGLPADRVIDAGMLPQQDMAILFHECDVALFPNRCEGATNMMLPEALASGLRCIVSQNTGHLDSGPGELVDLVIPLTHQSPVIAGCALYAGYDGWGESDVDEIVAALQTARRTNDVQLEAAARSAATQARYGWSRVSPRLLAQLLSLPDRPAPAPAVPATLPDVAPSTT